MKKMEDMSKGRRRRRGREVKRQREEQKREKQKHLAPASALTPNTLVPY